MIDFLCQIKILPLKMLKLIKIPGFSRIFDQNSKFFQVFSKFPKFQGFPGFFCLIFRIPGKVATLLKINNSETGLKQLFLIYEIKPVSPTPRCA